MSNRTAWEAFGEYMGAAWMHRFDPLDMPLGGPVGAEANVIVGLLVGFDGQVEDTCLLDVVSDRVCRGIPGGGSANAGAWRNATPDPIGPALRVADYDLTAGYLRMSLSVEEAYRMDIPINGQPNITVNTADVLVVAYRRVP